MTRTFAVPALALGLALSAAGCGGERDGMMTGPNSMGPGAVFMSVAPPGGALGVSTSSTVVFRFGASMAAGMEQYVDLHMGDLAGPTVPMNHTWSADRTTLTCTPQSPLAPRTTYVVHLGGGMMTQAGQAMDYGQYGPGMGGQWIMGGMMGTSHGGASWGMMGTGWRNANGSYGMGFSFTTA